VSPSPRGRSVAGQPSIASTVLIAATVLIARRGGRPGSQPVDVAIVAGSVKPSKNGQVIRVHPIRHDRSRELGAFANPKGRPRRTAAI
jgi:hypothetical protein